MIFQAINAVFAAVIPAANIIKESAEAGERMARTLNNEAANFETVSAKRLKDEAEAAGIRVDLLERYKPDGNLKPRIEAESEAA